MGYVNQLLDAHNVKVLGTGDQWLVLAHGFGCDQTVWQFIVPHFLDKYKILLFDLMGAGSTNPQHFNFARYATLHAYADDLLTILDEMEIESCIYVGHSMSGMIGCIASVERPSVFQKLVLLSTAPKYVHDGEYVGGFKQEELNMVFDTMQSNFRAWVTGFCPMAVGADLHSIAVQEFTRTFFNMRPDIALSISKTSFSCDFRELLPLVQVPCYILQSHTDLAIPPENVKYMSDNLGGRSAYELMHTTGHLPQLSHPAVLVSALQRAIAWV